ncbi:MAG: nitrogen fixation protein NifQ, partial [Gammaproteobacteria bacterium]
MLELTPQIIHSSLMAVCRGDPVDDSLARILSSWMLGIGSLPDWLGLEEKEFRQMMAYHFAGFDIARFRNPNRSLDSIRTEETGDLRHLLLSNRTSNSESEAWMADIVTAGCLGSDHLWQDLGLWSRADLSELMLLNFHPLASRNRKNMRWKKFLYKQLCESEGIYICRSPSCEICSDYLNCFGP